MKNRKIKYGMASLAILLLGSLVFFGLQFKIPKLTVSIQQIKNVADDNLELTLEVEIKNQTPFFIDSDSVELSIYGNKSLLASSKAVSQLHVASFGKGVFTLPLIIDIDKLKSLGGPASFEKSDSVHYALKLNIIDSGSFLLPDTILAEHETFLPAFKLPAVSLNSVKANSLLAKEEPSMLVDLQVANYNPFPIRLQNPKYSMQLDEIEPFGGSMNGTFLIKPKGITNIAVPVSVDIKSVLSKTGKLLFNKDKLEMTLTLDAKMLSDYEFLNHVNVKTIVKGDMKTLMTTAKKTK